MKVDYSKAFIKASKKLSGKTLDNLRRTIIEVKAAKELSDITNCKKLINFTNKPKAASPTQKNTLIKQGIANISLAWRWIYPALIKIAKPISPAAT